MDKEQFTGEVQDAGQNLYHIAKSILYSDEDCADAIQNAILHAYANLSSLKNEKYFRTWLTRILINECYSILRGMKPTVCYENYPDCKTVESPAGYSELFLEIRALEDKYRIPFVLHYVEGFTAKEIGYMLNKSEASIKMRLLRARTILKQRLSD